MEPATWGFIGTIIGTIVGASASIFATYLNGKNNLNIQKSTEKFKRDELFREFQRDNLLKLQDELTIGMRLVGRVYMESFSYFKKNDGWKGFRLSDEVDTKISSTFQNLTKLTERVNDDELRQKIVEIRQGMESFSVAKTELENMDFINNLSEKYKKLMTDIGVELRRNY